MIYWRALVSLASALSVHGLVAPEISSHRLASAQSLMDKVYGSASQDDSWNERRSKAREVSSQGGSNMSLPQHMTVYGELGLDALVTILDAVGVEKGDSFLDIGSGDGILVSGAALLYHDYLKVSRGVEILPCLYERSLEYQGTLQDDIESAEVLSCPSEFLLGDVFNPEEEVRAVFAETTLAVCFATTWSRGVPGRKLDELSQALGKDGASSLPSKARLVVIDGILNGSDGFDYQGELRFLCADTAPYSTARLYVRE